MAIDLTERTQALCDFFSKEVKEHMGEVFSQELHEGMKVDRAYVDEDGFPTVIFNVHTESWMRNGFDIVHGGAVSTIVDFYSSISAAADPRNWTEDGDPIEELISVAQSMGVSRHITVQFLQATPINANIKVKCKVISNTKRNAFFTVHLFTEEGKLLAFGTHDKVKVDTGKPKL